MKLVVLTGNNVVRSVYHDIYNPTIYPEGERVTFSNGNIENIGNDFLLFEDHIPVTVGEQLDESMRDYDQSDRYIHMDIKDHIEEAVEEIKELFTDDKNKKE